MFTSQIWTVPSAPSAAKRRPSGLQARIHILSRQPDGPFMRRVKASEPVAMSQTWTGLPAAESISFKFSTAADEPQGDAQAFGVGDATPHNEFGLFSAPFGHPRHFERLVDPLPTDPNVLEQLELAGRIPPPSRAQRPRRR